MNRFWRGIPFLVIVPLLFLGSARAEIRARAFAFVDTHYVITAEVAGSHSFVVNFINLSDFVIVIQPSEFIYRGASGRFYIGQVFERENVDLKGEVQKYTASLMLKGNSFTGLNIVGAFRELEEIEELSIRIGAKRFFLKPMEKMAFEQLAAKIGDLDLKNPKASAALEEANIPEIGRVTNTDGTSDWDHDWQGLVTPEGVNPPKIIERPPIAPTSESRKARVHGKVKLSALITKSGGIQDLRVVRGLGHGLDQRALEGVRNGWVFLPATRNGEVMDVAIAFEVEFPASSKND